MNRVGKGDLINSQFVVRVSEKGNERYENFLYLSE